MLRNNKVTEERKTIGDFQKKKGGFKRIKEIESHKNDFTQAHLETQIV